MLISKYTVGEGFTLFLITDGDVELSMLVSMTGIKYPVVSSRVFSFFEAPDFIVFGELIDTNLGIFNFRVNY
jgi:hypothetical protein